MSFSDKIELTFKIIAQFNNWPDESVEVAVKEYFELIENVNSDILSTVMMGGGHTTLGHYINWMKTGVTTKLTTVVNIAVGTFDTQCNTILSLISVGTYAVCVYNLIYAVPLEAVQYSWAEPVQNVFHLMVQQMSRFTFIEKLIQELSAAMQNVYIVMAPQFFKKTPSFIVSNLRTQFWEGGFGVYGTIIVPIISCSLKVIIKSCLVNCSNSPPLVKMVKKVLNPTKKKYGAPFNVGGKKSYRNKKTKKSRRKSLRKSLKKSLKKCEKQN